MNYTTSLSGLICPPKSSKFWEFVHWWLPIFDITCLLYHPTSASSAQPHPCGSLSLATAQRCVSPAFSASSFLQPKCRVEGSLLMLSKVMTQHPITMEICPTSIALGLKIFLKDTLTFYRTDHASHLSHLWVPRALLCDARDITGNMYGLPKNIPPYLQCQLNSQLVAWAQLHR